MTEKGFAVRFHRHIEYLLDKCNLPHHFFIIQEMTQGLHLRTLHWQFKESLEPPRVVNCRTEEILGKGNMFAQVTVRFHTEQVSRLVFPSQTFSGALKVA